jgi:hypothetical protein
MQAVVVDTTFVVVGSAVAVVVVVILGLMLRQLQPSEILACANAARRGRMFTTGSASGAATRATFFATLTTAFCGPQPDWPQTESTGAGQTELVVVDVAVDVMTVLWCVLVLLLRLVASNVPSGCCRGGDGRCSRHLQEGATERRCRRSKVLEHRQSSCHLCAVDSTSFERRLGRQGCN